MRRRRRAVEMCARPESRYSRPFQTINCILSKVPMVRPVRGSYAAHVEGRCYGGPTRVRKKAALAGGFTSSNRQGALTMKTGTHERRPLSTYSLCNRDCKGRRCPQGLRSIHSHWHRGQCNRARRRRGHTTRSQEQAAPRRSAMCASGRADAVPGFGPVATEPT
jgi:hypothetical protein